MLIGVAVKTPTYSARFNKIMHFFTSSMKKYSTYHAACGIDHGDLKVAPPSIIIIPK
jgi:hypothetical protein